MKKLFVVAALLLSFAAQSQEYFTREYNRVITGDEEVSQVNTFVEFNAFNSRDVILRIENKEPVRYFSITEPEMREEDGIKFQIIGMQLANSNKTFNFYLFESGELLIQSSDLEKQVLFAIEKQNNTKSFKRLN